MQTLNDSLGQISLNEFNGNTMLLESQNQDNLGADVREQELYNFQKQQRQQTIRNNIILVTICNVVCLLGNTFAITFYQWYNLSPDSVNSKQYLWLNMLYLYDGNTKKYISFHSYRTQNDNVCSITNDEDCDNDLMILQYCGLACFFCILSSLLLQLYDIWRLHTILFFVQQAKSIKNKFKGRLLYFLIILGQSLALLTYYITILTLKLPGLSIKRFGVSYWVSVSCCCMMVIFAIYYRWSKNRYHRFLIMEKLLDQELVQQEDEFDLEH